MQKEIDQSNAKFWDELCGSALAKRLGIRKITRKTLRKFDRAYMKKFPYLHNYHPSGRRKGKRILEIGTGYGTLGQIIASEGFDYHSLDIAEGPSSLMYKRMKWQNARKAPKVLVASALAIPFKDESFNRVYAIGCLHHTGNLPTSVDEVYRVLEQGGKALVMLYNRHSLRYAATVFNYFRKREFLKGKSLNEYVRGQYDDNSQGKAAPHTDFTTRSETKELFQNFSQVKIEIHKLNPLPLPLFDGKIVIPKMFLTKKLMKAVGSDLYITATK